MVQEARLDRSKKWAISFLISSITVTFINGPLTVIKELTPLKEGLKYYFGHHWVGHGILLLILFLVIASVSYGHLKEKGAESGMFKKLTVLLVIATFFMFFFILGFYIYEYTA